MKLNISSKELLALHNLLHARYGSVVPDEKASSSDVALRQVYNRLRACVIAALTNKASDPFEAWQHREQAKIDDLHAQNDDLKKVPGTLVEIMQVDPADDDFSAPYPRRGAGGRPGKRSGNKR